MGKLSSGPFPPWSAGKSVCGLAAAIAAAIMVASCASGPAPTSPTDIVKWYDMPTVSAQDQSLRKLLGSAPSLADDKLGEESILLRYPIYPVSGQACIIMDISVVPSSTEYRKTIPLTDFSRNFYRKPGEEHFYFTHPRDPSSQKILALKPSDRKAGGSGIFKNTPQETHKVFKESFSNLQTLDITTLSGKSLVAGGGQAFKPGENAFVAVADSKDASSLLSPSDIVWEGLSFDPPFYVMAIQGKDYGYKVDVDVEGKRYKAIYRNFQFVFVFAPSEEKLLSCIKPTALFRDGYSIVDGFDAEGYDRSGRDREGYDKWGWSGRARYAAQLTEIAPASPAQAAGLKVDDRILTIDGEGFLSPHSLRSMIAARKAGEAVIFDVRSGTAASASRAVRLVLGSDSRDPGRAFLGVKYNAQEWYQTEPANRKGESWSGTLARGRQGWGLSTAPDGGIYIGGFRDDVADGIGVLVPVSGAPQIQEWRAGSLIASRAPSGSILSPLHKWIYLGESSRNGLAHGRGDAISADGRMRIENGLFEDGRLVEGVMILADGARLSGSFAGDKLQAGTIVGIDGSRYEGQLANGAPEGQGKISAADGTVYAGEFRAGLYEGQGTITRPDGEKYEGAFKAGQPHGLGIYINGPVVERCEYYEGRRIDQAYLIRLENEKQLEAIRAERERIAKEKADKAEQDRIAAERAAAARKASGEKSSNNLIAGLFGVGAALAGGSIGMNAGEAALLGLSTASDVAKGDASMSGMKATGQDIVESRGGTGAQGNLGGQGSQGGLSPGQSASGASAAAAQQRKKPTPHTIYFNGKDNPEVTAEIDPKYFTTYTYPDGSWFALERGGTGLIHYAIDGRGSPNKGAPMKMTWGVQLTADGYPLERSGFLMLYVILSKSVSGADEDKAEMLELGDGHASGWKMK